MILYMPLFKSCKTIKQLTQLHGHLIVTSLHSRPQASTKLLDSYSLMTGSLRFSNLVFRTHPNPDPFMCAVLLKCHVSLRLFKDALFLYFNNFLSNGFGTTAFLFPPVLRACAGFGDLGIGQIVHARVVKCGVCEDGVVQTSLVDMYGDLGWLADARRVFDEMSERDVVSWTSILSSYVDNGQVEEAFGIFGTMLAERVEYDPVTMISVAEGCGELGFSRLARSVHSYIVRSGDRVSEALDNSLIGMYSKCDDLVSAQRVFRSLDRRTVASWTSMISCYNRSGLFEKALAVFVEMLKSKIESNVVTVMSVLGSCAGLRWLRGGKSVHCYVLKNDVLFDGYSLVPPLIELFAECGKLDYCEKVLYSYGERNIVSWNVLISIFAREGLLEEALLLVEQMLRQGLMPDSFTLSSSISICGDAGFSWLGKQMHGYALKRCILSDEFVSNSLIDMYSKCGLPDLANLVFNEVHHKSLVAWNSMISGFSQNGHSYRTLSLFDQMWLNHIHMNEVTLLTATQACAHLGHLEKGKWLHHKHITSGFKDLYIDTALIDMYAKCGEIQMAQRVFNNMSERSVVTWSVMISGHGSHGDIEAAISHFDKMVESGLKPNDVSFMNILSACSHSGYVEQGKYYFNLMKDFRVEPNSELLACMVDLLSRVGDLDAAYEVIKSMPIPADASIWGSLLGGCRIHQRMDMIKIIERDLLNVSTDDTGYYAALSNIFAESGNWDEFRAVRSSVKRMGLKKVPGYSLIEFNKKAYRFGAGDTPHWQMKEIYSFLQSFQNLANEHFYDLEVCNPVVDVYNNCILSNGNAIMNNNESSIMASGSY